jgi:hypothetical protein
MGVAGRIQSAPTTADMKESPSETNAANIDTSIDTANNATEAAAKPTGI